MFEAPLVRDLDPEVTPAQLAKAIIILSLLAAAVALVMNYLAVLYTGLAVAALAGAVLWYLNRYRPAHNPWKILMSPTDVRILHESGREVFKHRLDEIERIDLPIGFALPHELVLQPTRRAMGIGQQNHVLIEQDGTTYRYDFKMPSQAMLIRLQKLVLGWQRQGYPVKKSVKLSPGPFPGWIDDGRPPGAKG